MSAQDFSIPMGEAGHALYTKFLSSEAVSPNEVFNNLHESQIYAAAFREDFWKYYHTGLRASFVSVAQIPGSQNTVQRSEYMKKNKQKYKCGVYRGIVRCIWSFVRVRTRTDISGIEKRTVLKPGHRIEKGKRYEHYA